MRSTTPYRYGIQGKESHRRLACRIIRPEGWVWGGSRRKLTILLIRYLTRRPLPKFYPSMLIALTDYSSLSPPQHNPIQSLPSTPYSPPPPFPSHKPNLFTAPLLHPNISPKSSKTQPLFLLPPNAFNPPKTFRQQEPYKRRYKTHPTKAIWNLKHTSAHPFPSLSLYYPFPQPLSLKPHPTSPISFRQNTSTPISSMKRV